MKLLEEGMMLRIIIGESDLYEGNLCMNILY